MLCRYPLNLEARPSRKTARGSNTTRNLYHARHRSVSRHQNWNPRDQAPSSQRWNRIKCPASQQSRYRSPVISMFIGSIGRPSTRRLQGLLSARVEKKQREEGEVGRRLNNSLERTLMERDFRSRNVVQFIFNNPLNLALYIYVIRAGAVIGSHGHGLSYTRIRSRSLTATQENSDSFSTQT